MGEGGEGVELPAFSRQIVVFFPLTARVSIEDTCGVVCILYNKLDRSFHQQW